MRGGERVVEGGINLNSKPTQRVSYFSQTKISYPSVMKIQKNAVLGKQYSEYSYPMLSLTIDSNGLN